MPVVHDVPAGISADTLATALLDAIPDATAILDRDGVIVAVNRAWRMFARDNGGNVEATCEGVSYVDICRRSIAAGCEEAEQVARALQAVTNGDIAECDVEYACPSPAVGRWFMMRVTPLTGALSGVLVSHVNVTRLKRAEQRLERQASEDPLTGLANQMLLRRRLASALETRSRYRTEPDVGVLFIDLDGFKAVNDTYGHAAGDELLQTVAARLRAEARPQDTAARIGGDEFVIVAPRITEDGLERLAHRLGEALCAPYLVHGGQVTIGASIGTTLAAAGEDGADALRTADMAMYAQKRSRSQQPDS